MILHDWTKENFDPEDVAFIGVGLPNDDAAERTTWHDVSFQWFGPSLSEARALGLRAAEVAWRVSSAVTGIAAEDLPDDMRAVAHFVGDRDEHMTPAIRMNPDFTRRLRTPKGKWPLAPTKIGAAAITEGATAILNAAASRAVLPVAGYVEISFGEDEGTGRETAKLPNCIRTYDAQGRPHSVPIHQTGALGDAITALAAASHICDPGSKSLPMDGIMIHMPKSATLRAGFELGLRDRAPGEAAKAAAFLKRIGLDDVAGAFRRDYA